MTNYAALSPWRLMDDFLGFDWPLSRAIGSLAGMGYRYPRVNVWEGPKGWVFEAEVPGVDPDKLDVHLEGRELSLKGNRERADGGELAFERRFELPQEVAPDDIKANFKNGVLSVTLPRHPASEPRRLMIEVK
ncbi:MAG: Hsp20/alpha crystallin family protein [bacterium]